MRILFETLDLKNASPATVSRCGMVYLDHQLQVSDLIQPWINKLNSKLKGCEKVTLTIKYLFDENVEECIKFVERCPTFVPISREHMVFMLLKLLNLQIAKFLELKSVDRLEKCMVQLFHWCLVWSIGSVLDAQGRTKFSIFLRDICQEKVKKVFPEEGSVFEYNYNMVEERFQS